MKSASFQFEPVLKIALNVVVGDAKSWFVNSEFGIWFDTFPQFT